MSYDIKIFVKHMSRREKYDNVKKFVMTSKIHHDVKKFAMMLASTS